MAIKNSIIFLFAICAIALCGCTAGGMFLSQNLTNIELSRANYDIVVKDVSGSAYAEYLIGFSGSYGAVSNTLALVRVGGTATLYNDAIKSLWKDYEETYGSTEGRNLVLANVRYDTDILNLILYTKTTLNIHADVIEFREE